MNTNLKTVVAARVIVGPYTGGPTKIGFRFPDGTEQTFECEPDKKDSAIANAIMDWVKQHSPEERAQWIERLALSEPGSMNLTIQLLLKLQAQAEKTGKWPWKH